MLKIGVMTADLLERLGIDETFSLLGECGFDFVDFSCSALNGSAPGLGKASDPLSGAFDRPFGEIKPLLDPYRAAAARNGLTFGQAHAPFPLCRPDSEARSECLRAALQTCAALCGYLGCPHLIVHPVALDDAKEEWRVNMEMYKGLAPMLKAQNVVCCLENMILVKNGKAYEAVCADPYEACDYIDELNDYAGEKRFAFCLDTGRALLTGRDIYTTIMKLGSRIETLHIHDNDGRNDQRLTPYMGTLDWERFIMGVREAGYTGGLCFETNGTLRSFDRELTGDAVRLIAAAGRMFARRIETA